MQPSSISDAVANKFTDSMRLKFDEGPIDLYQQHNFEPLKSILELPAAESWGPLKEELDRIGQTIIYSPFRPISRRLIGRDYYAICDNINFGFQEHLRVEKSNDEAKFTKAIIDHWPGKENPIDVLGSPSAHVDFRVYVNAYPEVKRVNLCLILVIDLVFPRPGHNEIYPNIWEAKAIARFVPEKKESPKPMAKSPGIASSRTSTGQQPTDVSPGSTVSDVTTQTAQSDLRQETSEDQSTVSDSESTTSLQPSSFWSKIGRRLRFSKRS